MSAIIINPYSFSKIGNDPIVVLGSLGPNEEIDPTPYSSAGYSTTTWLATQFTTGTTRLTLDTLKVGFGGNDDITAQTVSVELRNNNNGNPGTLIASNNQTFTLFLNNYFYQAQIIFNFNFLLNSETSYWIVIKRVSGNTSLAISDYEISSENNSGWVYNTGKRSTNSGSTWNNYFIGPYFMLSFRAF